VVGCPRWNKAIRPTVTSILLNPGRQNDFDRPLHEVGNHNAHRNANDNSPPCASNGSFPTRIGFWKRQAIESLPDVFANGREQVRQQADQEKIELYQQIGQLKVELDFLKKKSWARLRSAAYASIRITGWRSRGNASCWACRDRVTTARRKARASRTCA